LPGVRSPGRCRDRPVLTSAGKLRSLAIGLLRGAGVPEGPARRTAELLVVADVWGVGSHGLMRLPYYLARLRAGGLRPGATLRVVRDSGAVIAFHGEDGLGHWQAWQAAEEAARRAALHGVAIASVGSSSHCGCLGAYTLPGIRQGLITMVFSTGPAAMAAPGSMSPVLSTSPLAVGIPCRPAPAIVDLATTAVARGRIAAHAKRGEPLPSGWAADASGAPTTDPQAALNGMLTPLGGGKGFALAFMVEALAAAAVGPELAVDIPDMFDASNHAQPQRIGHLIVTFDPAMVDVDGQAEHRLNRLAALTEQLGGRVPGAGRQLPWEIGDDTQVDVPDTVLDELRTWGSDDQAVTTTGRP
jgi:(2R)-3-sulfolactate dehydrogenase (NADP+)